MKTLKDKLILITTIKYWDKANGVTYSAVNVEVFSKGLKIECDLRSKAMTNTNSGTQLAFELLNKEYKTSNSQSTLWMDNICREKAIYGPRKMMKSFIEFGNICQ